MYQAPDYKDVPILLVDAVGFSQLETVERKRALLASLQDILRAAAKFFMPYGDPWQKWRRHGTGDGYYFIFDGSLGPQVALKYALDIKTRCSEFNRESGRDIGLRLRQSLAFGDVELVDDQLLSEAFIEAERFISNAAFKRHADQAEDPAPVVATELFHFQYGRDRKQEPKPFEQLEALTWRPIAFADKHGKAYRGYYLGDDWRGEEPEAPAAAPPVEPAFRILILVAHSSAGPLPEAIDLLNCAVADLKTAGVSLEVRLNLASVNALRLEAQEGCDLLIYFGHGNDVGQLFFLDGPVDYAALSPRIGLQKFWEELPACLIFACHGKSFAEALPCPWIAFGDTILREAPKGFLHAFAAALKTMTIDQAVKKAAAHCQLTMQSSFAAAICQSASAFPTRRLPAGEARVIQQSPATSGRYEVDYGNIEHDGAVYPEHDPFVGRAAELAELARLPDPGTEVPVVQRFWVHGGAGLGKSALLRQHAVFVRDTAFRPETEPVWLLHAYCQNCVLPGDVEKLLCAKAARLYGLTPAPSDLRGLMRALRQRHGAHVWLLDDLTYLRDPKGDPEQAYRLTGVLADLARENGVFIQLLFSARFGPPQGWRAIELTPLSDAESLELGARICREAKHEFTPAEQLAARELLARCGRSTAHYKRALLLAMLRMTTIAEYAEQLDDPGSLENLNEDEFSDRMLRGEIAGLVDLEARDGFAYSEFFGLYEPLILRVGDFSECELLEWLGERLCPGPSTIARGTRLRNGLTQLTRFGYLAVRKDDRELRFYMPPNQRLAFRRMAASAPDLPAEVPFRAPKARLSAALERLAKGSRDAITEVLQLERDYSGHIHIPDAAEAVVVGMLVRAELAGALAGLHLGLAVYDDVVRRFGDRPESGIAELVAKGLVKKGAALGALDRFEEELGVYDEVVRRFEDRPESGIAGTVAVALFNKGVRLEAPLDRFDEALGVYDEVVRRFGDRPESGIAERVAKALFNKGVRLGALDRFEEALGVYDEVVRRFGDRPESGIAELVAMALFNKGVRLGALVRFEEELGVYDDVVRRFGDRPESGIAEQVAKALFNKGGRLVALDRSEEALGVYDDVVRRFGDRPESGIAERVAKAMCGRVLALVGAGKRPEAETALTEAERFIAGRPEPAIRELFAQFQSALRQAE
ncbi:MAG: hypothetical protein HY763_10325 [Planctomycetes bacterium]|nr:hypothetical protein [Planctomycetota bacterium]